MIPRTVEQTREALPGKILIVDDEETLRSFMRDLMRTLGHESVLAESGPRALDLLREQEFDLMITDLVMPGMNGIDVLREARQIDGDLISIMLTGQGSMESAIAAIREMAYAFVTKPFELEEFTETIRRALEKRRLIRANRLLIEELQVARDTLERRVHESTADLARKVQDLENLNRRLKVLYDIARNVRGTQTLEDALREVIRHLRSAIRFESCFCFVFGADARRIRFRFHEGERIALSHRLEACVLKYHEEVIDCLTADPDPQETARLMEERLQKWGFSTSDIDHLVLAPMNLVESLHGLLCLSRQGDEAFTLADRQMLQIVASAAVSLYEENTIAYRTSQLRTFGELTAEIAHDLKHPLTNIKGGVQLAGEAWYDTERRDYCMNMIHEEIRNMDRLLTELMEMTRSHTAKASYVDVRELVHKTLERCKSGLERAAIAVRVDLDANDNVVIVNEDEMIEAFANLVVNAIQAMGQGGELSVHTRGGIEPEVVAPATGAGKYVEVAFTDTGCGIAEDRLRRIFERYFTTKENGNGLGLAMVDRVVKKNLGYITVESREGEGSTFTVGLPLC